MPNLSGFVIDSGLGDCPWPLWFVASRACWGNLFAGRSHSIRQTILSRFRDGGWRGLVFGDWQPARHVLFDICLTAQRLCLALQRKADGAHLRQKRLHLKCHQKWDW